MRTYVILDFPSLFPLIEDYLTGLHNVVLIVDGKKNIQKRSIEKEFNVLVQNDLTKKEIFNGLDPNDGDRVMLCFTNAAKLNKCLDSLLSLHENIPVIIIENNNIKLSDIEFRENIFLISVKNLVTSHLSLIWRKIENRKNIEKINKISQSSENVLILLQNDPDPDALASGLALRMLLGRNKQTAPIGTFGEVTRNENLHMIKLLDIPVLKLEPRELNGFSSIAMVDVQPPYFKGLDIKADIVIDHHPQNEKYNAQFSDIRTQYGATSTILGQYLIDQDYKITHRLATALVYGIKTDTMFLEREVCSADIEVFTYLFPEVNMNMLRRIEHPTLEYTEINGFVKALKNIKIAGNIVFTFLGSVQKEDIIPRLADFCLQIGEAEWSFVSGTINGNYVCSVRNVGFVKHAGEIIYRAFGTLGRAGGHRSMAKAVIPSKDFNKLYKVFRKKKVEEKIMEVFLNAMDS